jgi:type I restriction-modification system DNA methylase subunit
MQIMIDNDKFDLILQIYHKLYGLNNQNAHNDSRFKYESLIRLNADWAFYQNIIYHLKKIGLAIATGTKGALARSIVQGYKKEY